MTRRPAYAQTTLNAAPLTGDYGLQLATRWFGEEAIASLPILKAGPNKGKIKGWLVWHTTTTAGYHPNAGGGVGIGTVVRAWISECRSYNEGAATTGMWYGRRQTLCGSRSVLGPEARERDAREQARTAARWAAELAEAKAEIATA